jgi:ubiquinone/menaquinone biosynthesis C-methylase UbiE
MAEFHFVEDYERHVAGLIEQHSLDEAMSLAVGGNYEYVGRIEVELLRRFGLRDGMSLFDLGCGSGRLAAAIGSSDLQIEYLGTDVVQALLDYAQSKSSKNYRFILCRELSIPSPDHSFDFACAFSVFTHLLHQESFIYLEEMRRILRPDGRIVFSFIEFASPNHWMTFEHTVAGQRSTTRPVLNQFIERNAIEAWAAHLGFRVETFVDDDADFGGGPLGQSVVVLQRTG